MNMFITMRDLNEGQRVNPMNQLKVRQVNVKDYTWDDISEAFIEYLNNPHRQLGDPNVKRRTADLYHKRKAGHFKFCQMKQGRG
eukprot:6175382-Karenia_brevis.AAC.1